MTGDRSVSAEDFDAVVLDLAVGGQAFECQVGLCAEAEAGKSHAFGGIARNGDIQRGVFAGDEFLSGDDDLVRRPDAVLVEVDPGVEVTGSGKAGLVSGRDRDSSLLAGNQIAKDDSVFVVQIVFIVAHRQRICLPVGFGVDNAAKVEVLAERVTGSRARIGHCGVARRSVAEVIGCRGD